MSCIIISHGGLLFVGFPICSGLVSAFLWELFCLKLNPSALCVLYLGLCVLYFGPDLILETLLYALAMLLVLQQFQV